MSSIDIDRCKYPARYGLIEWYNDDHAEVVVYLSSFTFIHVHSRLLYYSTTLSIYREFITLRAPMYFSLKRITSPTL